MTRQAECPRILFFEGNPDGTVGGSYFSLLYLVEGVDRTRFQPLVAFRRDIPFVQRFRDAGLDVFIVDYHRAVGIANRFLRIPGVGAALRILQSSVNAATYFLVSVPRWFLFLRRHRISLVHANNSVTRSHDLMLGAFLAGIPVVTHERGINSHYSRLTLFVSRRLAAIICISDAVRKTLEDHGIGRGNLRVVFNGIDAARVRPLRSPEEVRRAHRIGPDQPVVVMLGNIKHWKGQEVVVQALGRIVERHPHVVCLFVGGTAATDEPYERHVHALVEQLGVRDNVRFTGYQENVADYVNAAVLSIHASILPEPFGRVLLEAMALRKPVVGSRGGAVPEIVVDGVTGYTFAEGSADDLAMCITELLDSPARTVAMGEAGYDRLNQLFNIRDNVARTQAIYETVLSPIGVKKAAAAADA